LGAAGTGSYIAPAVPGTDGPRAPAFGGFDDTNNCLGLTVPGGYVTVPPLNLNTNTLTITAWVKTSGNQVPLAALLLNRWPGTSAGLTMDAAGGYGLGYTWNDDAQTYNWSSGLSLPDSDWAFVALSVQPSQAALFVGPGTNHSSFAGATNFLNHIPQAFDGPTLFGSDLQYPERSFLGALDEIAIFNRSLRAGELFTLYAAGVESVPPRIFGDPQAPTNQLYPGDSLILEVDAGGSPTLSYQWRKDGLEITDATSSRFVNTSLDPTNSGAYDVVVSNQFGFATSAPAIIQVSSETIPAIVEEPVGRTLYPGGTLALQVVASGGSLQYQWEKDGNAIPDATNANYFVAMVTPADTGLYIVSATNHRGSVLSTPVSVSVVSPVSGSYEATIVSDAPEAWWRLDESTNATVMLDSMGRHDGTYNGLVTLAVPGLVSGAVGTAASFAGAGFGSVPFSAALNPPQFTLECWAKSTNLQETLCPASSHFLGKGCYFVTAAQGSGQWEAAFGSAGSEYYLPSTTAAATMKPDAWTYLVITFDPTNLFRFFINGQWDGASYVDFDHNNAGPLLVGARGNSSSVPADLLWKGEIDEVAFYSQALSLAQVQSHYASALYGTNTAPIFKLQPQSQVAQLGAALMLRS
ncbi:MAG TPA: LamG-like jellyroll fold domain-containing protein, partial [Verrucomicrobiae bacterium]|nr:LamG-like jellyroll fold domain-containing protein [Verrucomicrobiae bacterium]